MKKYTFNEYCVCINPDKEVVFDKHGVKMHILLACDGPVWCFSTDREVRLPNNIGGGSGYPSRGKNSKAYKTKDEAREAAMKALRDWCRVQMKDSYMEEDKYQRIFQEAIDATRQLTLF